MDTRQSLGEVCSISRVCAVEDMSIWIVIIDVVHRGHVPYIGMYLSSASSMR